MSIASKQDGSLGEAQTSDRLHLVLEHAPVLVYLVDENNRFLNVNRAWLAQTGLAEETLIGRSLYDVFDEKTAATFEANNREVLAANAPRRFEEQHAGKYYVSVKVPVCDPTGRPYAICGMSVDISDRVNAESLLRESEERFRIMADGLPLKIWVHDANGEQQFVNRRFCEFFGVSLAEMRANRWQALVHPDDVQAYSAAFAQCVQERRPFHEEVRVARADGEWRWIESWAQPRFAADGTFLGMVGASADITSRKEMLAQLAEGDAALRAADRKKNEFIAILGHELRNPLAAVRNAAQIVKMPGLHEDDRRAALAILDRQVDHLMRLADDLLDISRITSGKVSLKPETIDLRSVVDDALAGSRTHIEGGGHRFIFQRPEAPVLVDGDRVRLCQVLANLLSNAARYTPSGGVISLTLAVAQARGEALLTVEDNGAGLAPEELDVIFEPFVQGANEEESSPRSGLGIGLALAKSFVELHGGTITANSAGKGRGSAFSVRLPLAISQT